MLVRWPEPFVIERVMQNQAKTAFPRLLALTLASIFVTSATSASAEPAERPASLAPPLPPPVSASPRIVEPAPGQAAAAAPSPSAIPITATCTLGEHGGVDRDEARTAADVVCHELARRGATNTQHEVRFGKLGGKTLVTLASRNGNAYDERRTFVNGLDEIHVAGPRLASALAEGKPMEETRNVDNVLAAETRETKVQRGQMSAGLGFFGTTGVGAEGGASAGFDLALAYRAGQLGFVLAGRAGGIGSGDTKIGLASLDIGARYYLGNADVAPFVGGGLGLAYYELNRRGGDFEGSGFGGYTQAGIEMLRTQRVTFTASLRLDLPFYALEGNSYSDTYAYGTYPTATSSRSSQYVMPLSFNVGLLFH